MELYGGESDRKSGCSSTRAQRVLKHRSLLTLWHAHVCVVSGAREWSAILARSGALQGRSIGWVVWRRTRRTFCAFAPA